MRPAIGAAITYLDRARRTPSANSRLCWVTVRRNGRRRDARRSGRVCCQGRITSAGSVVNRLCGVYDIANRVYGVCNFVNRSWRRVNHVPNADTSSLVR